jgi:DNA-directed RNA polymerase specialized sigma24 family protein
MRERYRAAVDTLPPKTREVYMLHPRGGTGI